MCRHSHTTKGAMRIHVNNFTDQPYKLKKGMHIANFSVMTPEQLNHVRPINPVSTWHLLNENEEDAIYYISSLLKANRNNDQYEQHSFPTPENPGVETTHYPNTTKNSQRITKPAKFRATQPAMRCGIPSKIPQQF